jgi:hypothetical protein
LLPVMPRPFVPPPARALAFAHALALAGTISTQSWLPSSPFPSWGNNQGNVTLLAWDPSKTSAQNGAVFENLAENLQPGETLSVGQGVWTVSNRFDLSIVASASNPARIVAANPSNRPIITRPNAGQNCLNVGSNGPCRYLVLQNLEFTGGGDLLRIYDGSNLWIDGCFLHDGNGVGIAVQTNNCDHLYLTRNEIARPGPGTPGEGMYLGGNYGSIQVTDSVVAYNHVHDLRSAIVGQGDGIELKQASTRNWILGNQVHGCRNPCILVYGTAGVDENLIERNFCYDGDDAVLQVQGEAIVRNNVAIGGSAAFQSHDHQGVSSHLQVVHNTFVSTGRAATLARWGGRTGMVLANNVMYSTTSYSVWFGIGDAGVTAAGNLLFGPSNHTGGGYAMGGGLGDFVHVDLQSFAIDARPRVGGLLDNRGDPFFQLATDQAGAPRTYPADPGALANAGALAANVLVLPTGGGTQQLTIDLGANYRGASYTIAASARTTANGFATAGYFLPIVIDDLFVLAMNGDLASTLRNGIGVLDLNGRASATVLVPPVGPAFTGLSVAMCAFVVQNGLLVHVSNAVSLTLQ